MKKIISAAIIMLSFALFGTADAAESAKFSAVVTIFPIYDWVRHITGSNADDADVSLLLRNGIDMHSYQPTVDDIIRISASDLFICVGGESDSWTEKALGSGNKKNVVLKLLELTGDAARREELLPGMEGGGHEHEEHKDEHAHDAEEYDEHVWLSLKNAERLCAYICDALAELNPARADEYRANLTAYTKRLTDLDARYRAAVESSDLKTLLFADRFPFRYLAEDYGLTCFAAFPGCSAETEASFSTIAFLAGKLDEERLPAVLILEGSDSRLADTVISSSSSRGIAVLRMDSMQSMALSDAEGGADYLSVMESNLETLKAALNGGER